MVKPLACLVLLVSLPLQPLSAAGLKPVAVDVKGKVTAAEPAAEAVVLKPRDAVAPGTEITSGNGRALFALVPGMSLVLKEKSAVKILAAESGPKNRFAEVALIKGKVACSLKKEGSQKQRYRLDLGHGHFAEAVGTSWEASVDEDTKQIVVTSGVVSYTLPGGLPAVAVPAGSILTVEFDTVNGVATMTSISVLNLVDGTLTTYPVGGGEPVTVLATAAQLAGAREAFETAVGQNFDALDPEDRAGLLSLLFSINKTLASAGAGSVASPGAGGGATGGGGNGNGGGSSNNPSDSVSPISPPNS